MRRDPLLRLAAITPLLLGLASVAHAQTVPPPQPLLVEKIPTGVVIAPDFKATGIDNRFAQLAVVRRAAAGERLDTLDHVTRSLTDDTLLICGAAYWLVNGSDDFRLAYGGLLVGWNAYRTSRVRFGARGLVGVGSATLGRNFDGIVRGGRDSVIRFGRAQASPAPFRGAPIAPTIHVRVADDFFVFEPQANVAVNLTQRIAVTGAAGYRAVAATDALGEVLDGPTINLGLQFGW